MAGLPEASIDTTRNKNKVSDLHEGKKPIGFNLQRAASYAAASTLAPNARDAEIQVVRRALDSLGHTAYTKVVELGAGQGFGTSVLLNYVSLQGGQIHAVDASQHMTSVMQANERVAVHVGHLEGLSLEANSVDLAFSLAAFHHIPNKFLVLQELYRVLSPGAYILIIDVEHETEAQATFDYIVRPYCPTGHDADFLDHDWVEVLCRRTGLTHISSRVDEANWIFSTRSEMTDFMRSIFCLEIDEKVLDELAEKYLSPYQASSGDWVMPWSLGVHILKKP